MRAWKWLLCTKDDRFLLHCSFTPKTTFHVSSRSPRRGSSPSVSRVNIVLTSWKCRLRASGPSSGVPSLCRVRTGDCSPSEHRPDPEKHQDVHRVTSEFSSRHDKPRFSFEKFLVNIATAVGAAGRLQDPEFLMQRTDFYNNYITTVWQKKEKKYKTWVKHHQFPSKHKLYPDLSASARVGHHFIPPHRLNIMTQHFETHDKTQTWGVSFSSRCVRFKAGRQETSQSSASDSTLTSDKS